MNNDIAGAYGRAFNGTDSDGNKIEPGKRGPLAPGEYSMTIQREKTEVYRNNNGAMILSVALAGPEGRVWDNIYMSGPSATAAKIGNERLETLRVACGIPALSSTEQLFGKQVVVRVGIRRDDANKNEVLSYRAVGDAQQQPQQQQDKALPWMRK